MIAEIGPRLLHGFFRTRSPYPRVVCEVPAKYPMCAVKRAQIAATTTRISAGLSAATALAYPRNTRKRSARPKRMPACRAAINVASSTANT